MLKYNEAMEKYKEFGGKMLDKENVRKKLIMAKQEVKERNVNMSAKSRNDRGVR